MTGISTQDALSTSSTSPSQFNPTPSTTTLSSTYDLSSPSQTSTPLNPTKPSSIQSPPNAASDAFQFPPHYSFPPFFTLQPVLSTRTSQLQSWSSLIQSYSRHNRLFTLSLIDALDTPLFHNRALNRRLSLRDARAIIDWMSQPSPEGGGGRAEWISSTSSRKGRQGQEDEGGRFYVYWRRPEEWAGVIEKWVEESGQRGTVLTLYEIVESDATRREEFHGMDGELLQRCLSGVVKRGRAQVFGESGEMGVKFF